MVVACNLKIEELLDSVPFEETVAVSLLTIQNAALFRYVMVKGAVPLASVVTVEGTLPPSEFAGVSSVLGVPAPVLAPGQALAL